MNSKYLNNLKIFLLKKNRFRLRWETSTDTPCTTQLNNNLNFKQII